MEQYSGNEVKVLASYDYERREQQIERSSLIIIVTVLGLGSLLAAAAFFHNAPKDFFVCWGVEWTPLLAIVITYLSGRRKRQRS